VSATVGRGDPGTAIPCVDTIARIRALLDAARARGGSVGMVPTMGALHEGHLSLIRAARAENEVVVVSVFVNPTQFGPSEDLDSYPRDLEGDRALAAGAGADLVFSPAAREMYAEDFSTWVDVEGLISGLCGRSRPGHFRGVCTVVTKLLNICQPDRAYFGEKDAQQLAVVTRMVRDLDMRVAIVACPTVREPDGLALSSRNTRLTAEHRAQAPVLHKALGAARHLVTQGERDAARLEAAIRAVLAEAPAGRVEYVEIVDSDDLAPVATLTGKTLIALAVRFGDVRLIDNLRVTV
jgi:pantoate--beta-alanine ligase